MISLIDQSRFMNFVPYSSDSWTVSSYFGPSPHQRNISLFAT